MPHSVVQWQGTWRPVLRLVWPVLIEQILTMAIGLSDTVLAGKNLTQSHTAAMTVLAYILWAMSTVSTLVAIGATALVARAIGAGDRSQAERVTHQACLLGLVLAAATTALGFLLGERLLALLNLDPESIPLARQFLFIVLPVVPAMMLEMIGIACLRGAGNMVTGLATMVLVNVINLGLSWSLIHGAGPLPELGWKGIAIGTATGHFVGGIIPLAVLLSGRARLQLHWQGLRWDRPIVRRILHVGIPGGVDSLSIVGCQLLFLSIVNSLGQVATAAHGVAIRIESLAYLPGMAFQVAATTLVGQFLGARDQSRALRSVLVTGAMGCGIMTAAALVLFFRGEWLVSLFLAADQADVAQAAAPLLRIVATVLPLLAIMMVCTGALRGAGDTRWPLVFTLAGFLGVRMPLAHYWAQQLGWGVRGAWYAMAVDLLVRSLLVIARFARGAWRTVEV